MSFVRWALRILPLSQNLNSESYCGARLKGKAFKQPPSPPPPTTSTHCTTANALPNGSGECVQGGRLSHAQLASSCRCYDSFSRSTKLTLYYFWVTPYSTQKKAIVAKTFISVHAVLKCVQFFFGFGNVNKSENNSGNTGCAKPYKNIFYGFWIILRRPFKKNRTRFFFRSDRLCNRINIKAKRTSENIQKWKKKSIFSSPAKKMLHSIEPIDMQRKKKPCEKKCILNLSIEKWVSSFFELF